MLGICNEITAAEVAGVTVTINGEEQEVVFGEDGNVELRSEEAPDPPTGCPGLKFDFPLDKVDGTMQLCFKLTDPRAVGPIAVCLYGGGVTADSLTICGPICRQDEDDTVVAYHRSAVSVPVSVTHFAVAGTPLVTRCGAPEIIMGGSPAGSCGFTIRQQMCVALPMEFGAMVETGTPTTECLGAGGRPCACCGDDGEEEEGIISRPIHC